MTIAAVKLWGRTIGAVSQSADRDYAAYKYADDFVGSNIQLSPVTMPLSNLKAARPASGRVIVAIVREGV